MARRWAWWICLGLVLVVLLAFGTWRLLQEIPDLMAKVEDTIREDAEALGFQVSFRDLRLRPLHLRVSLQDLTIRDGIASAPLAHAEHVDISLSPWRFLSGRSPVSRVLVRTFSVRAGEANRALLEKLRASGEGKRKGELPEILLLDGKVRIGPMGPVERWEAVVPKIRINPSRFRGTHVTAAVHRFAGRIALPGAGRGNVPFDSLETDFFLRGDVVRVRKLLATGPSTMFTLSGRWEGGKQAADLKFSGKIDIAKFAATGAPGGEWLRKVASEGMVFYSAQVEGSLENPAGTGNIVARNVRFPGNTTAEANASVAVSENTIRLESLRGKLFDGDVSGSARYDFRTGMGKAKLSLEHASFGKAPWGSWGISWRPAGKGDLVLSLEGGREMVQGTLSLKNPGGFERPETEAVPSAIVALPVEAAASCDLVPGKEFLIRNLRVAAGGSEATGTGTYFLEDRRLSMTGRFLVPQGKAAEYGWVYPVSWNNIAGEWEVSGTADNPQVTAGVKVYGLVARALPPVPLTMKMTGDPTELVHFVADIPADVAKVIATGTIAGPLASRPALLEATVRARDIDFSLAEGWGAAVLSSLGKDPSQYKRQVTGVTGTGTADFQLSVAKGAHTLSGKLFSPEIRFPGSSARAVSVSGNWDKLPYGERWGFRASGEFGEGDFLLAGKGEGKEAKITGTMKDMNLETVVSLAERDLGGKVGGRANLHVEAKRGPKGWEIGNLSASVPRLTAAGLTFEEVSAEGSLGESSGTLSLVSASPRVRAEAGIRREKELPVSFSVRADGVPTGTLLEAIGRGEKDTGGTWDVMAEGIMTAAEMLAGEGVRPEAFSEFRFSLSAASPSISGVSFDAVRAEGKKEENVLEGEIVTGMPDTRLSFSLSLREPYGFRLEGPFAMGESFDKAAGDVPAESGESVPPLDDKKTHFRIAGRTQIRGSLLTLANSRGTLHVQRVVYRNRGIDLTGDTISILLSSDGIRWADGNLKAAGNPLRVSGGMSWSGDLDVRLDGTVPAAAIRLVTDIFDRVEGMVRAELRVTGKWDDPSVFGSGHLKDGTFSFRGYAQLFEKMNAEAVISKEKIIFENIEGRSGGGYLDGRGEVPLRFAEGQKMFFRVDFFDMRYPYPQDLRPVLQGSMELVGPVRDLLITGDVEIQSARYTKTVRPEAALLDFRKRLADVTARRQDTDFRIRLDISAVADGTIRVRNNLAEADIQGDFKVVGDTSRVIVLGAFDVTEGRVDYRDNRYELTLGVLEFQDLRRNNPRIDFRAETKKSNVTVTVSVTGTLDNLLSLGVTTESLAGAGGSVPAAEAAAIALGPYTGRMEEGIRNVVGLDKFAIQPSFSTRENAFEPRFIVGKSFGDRFSVSVSTNVGTTTRSSAFAEFKVLENVYLQGAWESSTSTEEGDLGADVKFRYRFRQFRDIFRDDD
jgi:hypothetical protein